MIYTIGFVPIFDRVPVVDALLDLGSSVLKISAFISKTHLNLKSFTMDF